MADRLRHRHDRARERERRINVTDELVPRPDPGHEAQAAARADKNAVQATFKDPDRDPELADSSIFAEDEIRARMKRDEERRLEKEAFRRVKELERDQERLGRLDKMRQRESDNMAVLRSLAKKRFG